MSNIGKYTAMGVLAAGLGLAVAASSTPASAHYGYGYGYRPYYGIWLWLPSLLWLRLPSIWLWLPSLRLRKVQAILALANGPRRTSPGGLPPR